ncbi:hypothetical protein [Rhizobium leguminosarum]|uniref:hypothetical protein n=1 Tax=Rhizobium leguminosarum TaxID=384 RepID=UPI00103FBE3B|nr:hypothetical protein [Rhizobium leguminosarum]TBZ00226.1 hypothetical protein E0H49_15850 [Rhizobium leguminosarum bv. viciae]
MAIFNPRDKSRTSGGKTFDLVKKHTRPPEDQGGWMAITHDLLESAAFRTLSVNATKAFYRIVMEHIRHGRQHNGKLIVTHEQFIEYGVTSDLVADALEELEYKKLMKMHKGRAGHGTAYPTVFTLTNDGTHDGAPATNEWKGFTLAEARLWSEVVRKQRQLKRSRAGNGKKSSLGNRQGLPLGNRLIAPLMKRVADDEK